MIKQKHSKLKMLSVNKSVVFNSPLEGDDVLVRTGTIAEGSCFLHSLLHAYSKEYISLNIKGRMEFVRCFRASLASKINREDWEKMGSGIIAKVPFQENVLTILEKFYKFLDDEKLPRSKTVRTVIKNLVEEVEVYKLIKELIPIDNGFTKEILPKADSRTEDDKISTNSDEIIRGVSDYLYDKDELQNTSKDKRDYIIDVAVIFIKM